MMTEAILFSENAGIIRSFENAASSHSPEVMPSHVHERLERVRRNALAKLRTSGSPKLAAAEETETTLAYATH